MVDGPFPPCLPGLLQTSSTTQQTSFPVHGTTPTPQGTRHDDVTEQQTILQRHATHVRAVARSSWRISLAETTTSLTTRLRTRSSTKRRPSHDPSEGRANFPRLAPPCSTNPSSLLRNCRQGDARSLSATSSSGYRQKETSPDCP